MPLPTLFANNQNPTGPELDGDFAALGAITPIPCAVAGTNSLTLTPVTNTPTVAAYNTDQIYCCVAAATNTGATQARVGSLPLLNVYKDTVSGPLALTGSEIVAGNFVCLAYDPTLNTGAGGFHLVINPAIISAYLPLSGGTLTGPLSATTVAAQSFQGPVTAAHLSVPTSASSITSILSAAVSLSFSSLTPGQNSDQSITLSGISVGDVVALGLPSAPQAGIGYIPFVASSSIVTVRAYNYTPSSTLTPTAGSYRATAIRSVP